MIDKYAVEYNVVEVNIGEYNWYFPFSGRMNAINGNLSLTGGSDYGFACYWTANHYKTASSYGAYYFVFSTFSGAKANTYEKRACGHAVRCVIDNDAQ